MSVVLARRVFRLLLAFYPRGFRLAYRDDMELLFAERSAEARLEGRAGRFWIRTVANVVTAGIAERWSRVRGRGTSRRLEARSPNMFGVVQDTRYAWRVLRRQPAFSLFVVATLAVGIGATTAVLRGVLVLSTFAGAARSLDDALVINPYDAQGTADVIARALRMAESEQRSRMRKLRRTVAASDAHRWAADMLADAAALQGAQTMMPLRTAYRTTSAVL